MRRLKAHLINISLYLATLSLILSVGANAPNKLHPAIKADPFQMVLI